MESRETDDEPYWQRFRRGPIGENEDTNASARILPALSIRGPVVRALLTLTWPLEGVCEHLIGRHRARASWTCPGMTLCRHMWPSLLRGRTTLAKNVLRKWRARRTRGGWRNPGGWKLCCCGR